MGTVESAPARRLVLRDEQGCWQATLLIDEIGQLAITSEWGNYQYFWSSPGTNFIAFLASLDNSYLKTKLMNGAIQQGMKGIPLRTLEGRCSIFLERVWPIFQAWAAKDGLA